MTESDVEIAHILGKYFTTVCDLHHATYGDDDLYSATYETYSKFSAIKKKKNLPIFLEQTMKELKYNKTCLIYVLVYIQRLHSTGKFILNWYNVHRVLLTCIFIADKIIDDDPGTILFYEEITGCKHISKMESKILSVIDYNVSVLFDEYEKNNKWVSSLKN